jgi:Ala-tRNA(Pro) deacylase
VLVAVHTSRLSCREAEKAPIFTPVQAVPAVGECYGLDVIVDDSIDTLPDVYLEGGDHITLIHLDQGQFARLNVEARHGRFSAHD